MHASAGVDLLDPGRPKLSLLQLAANVRVLPRLVNCADGRCPAVLSSPVKALGEGEDLSFLLLHGAAAARRLLRVELSVLTLTTRAGVGR